MLAMAAVSGAFVIAPYYFHLSKASKHVIQVKTEEEDQGCLHQLSLNLTGLIRIIMEATMTEDEALQV